MKRLFLVANSPLDKLEEAIIALNKRRKSLRQSELSWLHVWGRADPITLHRMYHVDILIFLGPSAYKTNADSVNIKSIGLMLGDPMNLNCIQGDCIEALDYKAKDDGFGFYLQDLPAIDIAKRLQSVQNAKPSGKSVTIASLDYIPTMLNSSNETVSFVKDYLQIYYSIRDNNTRDKLRKILFAWISSGKPTSELLKDLSRVTGKRATAPSLVRLVNIFEDNPKIRNALMVISRGVHDKKVINYDRLSKNAGCGSYDLKYMGALMRKKPLLIQEENSEVVHRKRAKERFIEDGEAV